MSGLWMALLAALWLLAACAYAPAPAGPPLTILISIDGFRPDYLQRGVTPTLARLAGEGASGAMRPSFPSNTFPNHYTLVTGLRPDRHGIVDNTMTDPAIPGGFALSKPASLGDLRWWSDAEPVWATAEKAGVPTATMFWPGSGLPIGGAPPRDWRPYDKALSAQARVDQVLAWLERPAQTRPRFVTLYFDEVDTDGHRLGPEAPELAGALQRTDAAIASLVASLQRRGLPANLVIVSDHGMTALSRTRIVALDQLLATDSAILVTKGAVAGLIPAPGREAEVERALLTPHAHMTCWRKGEIPARFHYGTHRRVPPIVCLAETGWTIDAKAAARIGAGGHGFDPADPAMAALFIGRGPAFRSGVHVATFDNVDIQPLLLRLLGLPPTAGDGNLDELSPALR